MCSPDSCQSVSLLKYIRCQANQQLSYLRRGTVRARLKVIVAVNGAQQIDPKFEFVRFPLDRLDTHETYACVSQHRRWSLSDNINCSVRLVV